MTVPTLLTNPGKPSTPSALNRKPGFLFGVEQSIGLLRSISRWIYFGLMGEALLLGTHIPAATTEARRVPKRAYFSTIQAA